MGAVVVADAIGLLFGWCFCRGKQVDEASNTIKPGFIYAYG
jgi:hypothetical protein